MCLSLAISTGTDFWQWVLNERTGRLKLVNKAELVETPEKTPSLGYYAFEDTLDHPPPGKSFAHTVAKFLQDAQRAHSHPGRPPQVVLMFEIANLPQARILVTLALCTIPISAVVGVLYGILKGPVADAISLASYIATAFSLFFAILGAGSWLGMDPPLVYTATDDLLEEMMQGRIREDWLGGRSSKDEKT